MQKSFMSEVGKLLVYAGEHWGFGAVLILIMLGIIVYLIIMMHKRKLKFDVSMCPAHEKVIDNIKTHKDMLDKLNTNLTEISKDVEAIMARVKILEDQLENINSDLDGKAVTITESKTSIANINAQLISLDRKLEDINDKLFTLFMNRH